VCTPVRLRIRLMRSQWLRRLYDSDRATASWFGRKPLVATVSLGILLTATLYLISNFSLVHPYLVADNRCIPPLTNAFTPPCGSHPRLSQVTSITLTSDMHIPTGIRCSD